MSDTTSDIEQARYPIGRFDMKAERTAATRAQAIADIEQLPARMRAAVGSLDPAVIDTPYREGGWTIRQLVHHVADSHMNGYIRLKFTLTEDNPALKGYQEALWAERAHVPALAVRPLHARRARPPVRLAQPPSRRAHHDQAREASRLARRLRRNPTSD